MQGLSAATGSVPAGARDLEFGRTDFERARHLIRQHAGIDLQPGKQDMVYSRLARRLRLRGLTRFRDYLDAVQVDASGERQAFINALTTNLTAFYREPHHFAALADRLHATPPGQDVRIWCCAASSGEEAYSIAITAAEQTGLPGQVHIEASDIDTEVLSMAERGVYPLTAVSGLPMPRLHRFFEKGVGRNAGKVRVRDALRQMVTFRPFNLLSDTWNIGPFDVVFCRNVMIYFDRPTQRRILERLHDSISPDGWLIVGHSENFSDHHDLFRLSGKTIYTRVTGRRA